MISWKEIRETRDSLLQKSDWTQLKDSQANSDEWAAYRQELRDIPQNYEMPEYVVWPETP